ncbi:PREDICTED: At4g02000 [Prunus dulcis]|uniref:PREDICTED: At4g02000 n=1 Tax=Prunus dulcis TaxID=3755 RepID=A0A5E4F1P7_PRUDU|nr:hypothetical protein L3X38_012277 [Prunus dulcis]VVA20571.1 PREDICTED: At4g02000 [Prunus dulcis]VVA20609.1 PREDICTED: At4g02000 [Prunus dulcis]
MGLVKVVKSKENVYVVTMEDAAIASRLLEGNPWFVKGHVFTLKQWPLYCSMDDIEANWAIFWVQAYGIPRNLCTMKNSRQLGEKVGSVMEVENFEDVGFRGFLRIRVDLDTSNSLLPDFFVPYPVMGGRKIHLKYKGIRDFCFICGKL